MMWNPSSKADLLRLHAELDHLVAVVLDVDHLDPDSRVVLVLGFDDLLNDARNDKDTRILLIIPRC